MVEDDSSERTKEQAKKNFEGLSMDDAESEGFNDWGGRGYDDFVPGEVTKTAPSEDITT